MMKKSMLTILICILLPYVCLGCTIVVDYNFYIEELDDFLEWGKDDNERESDLREGKLDFAKVGDVFVYTTIREITHETCAFYVTVYSLDDDSNQVTINSAKVSDKNGNVLYNDDSIDQPLEFEVETETMFHAGTMLTEIEINDEWFYDGNELELTVQVTVNDGENEVQQELTYEAEIIAHKRLPYY